MLRPFLMTVALTVLAATAGAQTFPAQAIRLVIPYAPGGGSDILARPVGADMALIRELANLGLAARGQVGVRIRQPLRAAEVMLADASRASSAATKTESTNTSTKPAA